MASALGRAESAELPVEHSAPLPAGDQLLIDQLDSVSPQLADRYTTSMHEFQELCATLGAQYDQFRGKGADALSQPYPSPLELWGNSSLGFANAMSPAARALDGNTSDDSDSTIDVRLDGGSEEDEYLQDEAPLSAVAPAMLAEEEHGQKNDPHVDGSEDEDEDEDNSSEDADEEDYDDSAAQAIEDAKLKQRQKGKGRRKSVSAEAWTAKNATKESSDPKRTRELSLDTRKLILTTLSDTAPSSKWQILFMDLGQGEKETIVDSMFDVDKEPGESIIEQGDEGDNFYVLEYGECEVFVNGTKVHTYSKPGDAFGELALMHNCPRAASVRAAKGSAALLWAMSRQTYQRVRHGALTTERNELADWVASIPFLSRLDKSEMAHITDLLTKPEAERCFSNGDMIIQQGDLGHELFVLRQGTAIATVRINGTEQQVKSYKPGDCFGELALVEDGGIRKASIIATSDAKCLRIIRKDFDRLIDAKAIMDRQKDYSKATDAAFNRKGPTS